MFDELDFSFSIIPPLDKGVNELSQLSCDFVSRERSDWSEKPWLRGGVIHGVYVTFGMPSYIYLSINLSIYIFIFIYNG